MYEEICQLIKSNIGALRPSTKGFMKRNCMMCGHRGYSVDNRQRFGIKFDTTAIGANCFNCGFKIKWEQGETLTDGFIEFLEVLGVPSKEIQRLQFSLFQDSKSRNTALVNINQKITVQAILANWKQDNLPENSRSIIRWIEDNCTDTFFLKAKEYLDSRNLPYIGFYWTPNTFQQMNRRVILPFVFDNVNVGYTARYYAEKPVKGIAKYINKSPDNFIYNLDAQTYQNKYLILCEGVLDAYVTQGISPLGSINDEQVRVIKSLNKEVIVIPDQDKAGNHLVELALREGWKVSFPPWHTKMKDAAGASQIYGRIATLQSIIEFAENDKFTIKLRRKMGK